MREKYIEERFPRLFIFGRSFGSVDLATPEDSTVCTINTEGAEKLMKLNGEAIDMLVTLATALDEENPTLFKELWYEM